MGQVIQTNGDYEIRTGEGNEIKLNTGPNVGSVRVTGNLIVEGDTLTVSAEQLNVQDNIITLNFGETGTTSAANAFSPRGGVALRYSGIQVDRGNPIDSPVGDASFVFDESADAWLLAFGSETDGFTYLNSSIRLQKILTDPDTVLPSTGRRGDLNLISFGTGVLTVIGTTDYENQVTQDDDIPNRKFVLDAILDTPNYQILRNDTRVVALDKDDQLLEFFPPALGPYASHPTDESGNPLSLTSVIIDNTINTEFYTNRTNILGLEIRPENNDIFISSNNTNENIVFVTNGTGKVEFNAGIQLDYQGVDLNVSSGIPASQDSSVILYSNTPGIGTTGLYFVNTERNGELISKNKALVFSMLF